MKIVCEKLYKLDPSNPKVIYRYCYALKYLCEFEEALSIIRDDNEELIKLRQEIILLYSKYKDKSKKIYKNLFENDQN